jgi:hypothetical protein
MDYYNFKLRLHGNVNHEVLKQNMSAPEVIVLRAIHGDEGVIDVKYSKSEEVDPASERERLHLRYGGALAKLEPRTNIQHMFGGDYMPLLETLKGVDKPKDDAKTVEVAAQAKVAVASGARPPRPAKPVEAVV